MKTSYKSMLSLAVLLTLITASQAQWIQTNGPFGGYVNDFAFLDSNVFSANSGAIFRSTVNGSSWSESGLIGKNVTAVEAAADGSGGMNMYACTSDEGVFLSTDSGNTWTAANNGLNNLNAYCIAVAPNGSGGSSIFVGLISGGICRSDDNGATWNPTGPISTTIYDIARLDSLMIAATALGIYLSDNYGVTWTPAGLSFAFTTSVEIIKNPSGNAELFAGTFGNGIYRSSNNGLNWAPFNIGLFNFFPTDFVVNDTSIYVSLYGQGVFTTTLNNGGWTLLNSIGDIRTITMYNNGSVNMFFMGIDDGTGVYRSPDCISLTYFVDGMINTNVTSVASINNGAGSSLLFSGYLGEGGKVMSSNDYGTHWNYSNTLNIFAIRTFPHNISGTMLIAGGLDAGSRCSADSGATWNLCMPDGLWSLGYFPLTTGGYKVFAATGSGVFQSTNSGTNWTPINAGIATTNIRAICISDTNVYAGTSDGVYTMSVNGSSWTYAGTGITSQDVYSMAAQGTHLFAGTQNAGIFHSINNGISWTPTLVGIPGLFVSELIFHGSILFAATNNGVYFTNDYGVSWTTFNTGLLSLEVNALVVIDSFLVAGTRFGVWLLPLSQIPTGIDSEIGCNNNDCYQLHVYPNPFTNHTTIEFSIPEKDFIKAEIFDVQGKWVSTLVNETLTPGKYNYSWDVGEVSQGIYFLKITSALQTKTQRLVRME